MKRLRFAFPVLALVLLAGCAEYKEYTYKEFTVSREQAYQTMVGILESEGYRITEISENYVNDLPEVYMETDWNMRQSGSVYPGNDMRRKAYVKITTQYSERKPREYQPLDDEDAERIRELEEDERKKAELEQTRIGIAVSLERRSDIRKPLETDWYYDGQDKFTVAELMGRFEAAWGEDKAGGGTKPSRRSEDLKRQELEGRYENR